MAKRMHKLEGEERIVAKSKSTAMNLSSHVPTSSSSAENLTTSSDPVKFIAAGETCRNRGESDILGIL